MVESSREDLIRRRQERPEPTAPTESEPDSAIAYAVRHVTEYVYDSAIASSYGRAHVLPRNTEFQKVRSSQLTVLPEPQDLTTHSDFYGNQSSFIQIAQGHELLRVTAESVVEVEPPVYDAAALSTPWEQVRDSISHAEWDDGVPPLEFRLASPRIRETPEVREISSRIFTPGRRIDDALADLTHTIYAEFDYQSGSTTVRTTLDELFDQRRGVCQDFAHLAVACCRSVGLAARYVSGYLRTFPLPGQEKMEGSDASHAWASVLVPGAGWVDIDPTNNTFADVRFVTTAWGRDYGDVPPLKGVVFSDGAQSKLSVGVDVNPVSTRPPGQSAPPDSSAADAP